MTRSEKGLRSALADYERDLVAAGKAPDTVHTYLDSAERFIKCLTNSLPAVIAPLTGSIPGWGRASRVTGAGRKELGSVVRVWRPE